MRSGVASVLRSKRRFGSCGPDRRCFQNGRRPLALCVANFTELSHRKSEEFERRRKYPLYETTKRFSDGGLLVARVNMPRLVCGQRLI